MKISRRFDLVCVLALSAGAVPAMEEDGAADMERIDTNYSCLIEPSEVVELGSPVAGIVDEITVERADAVAAGDTLIKLESVIETTNMELAREQAAFTGDISEQKLRVAHAARKLERAQAMYEQKALPLDKLEDAEAEWKLAREQLAKARYNHRIARLEYERAKELLAQRHISSPVDGVVLDRLAAPGEYVGEAPLLKLAKLDPLKVEVILPVETLGTVNVGDAIAIEASETGARYQAEVKVVEEIVDAASGTYRVTLDLPNEDNAIPAGLDCRLDPSALVPSVAGQ